MAQSVQCLQYHQEWLETSWHGIWICLYCAAKAQMAQDARDKLARARMAERGIIVGHDHTRFEENTPL